ncbi:hypothetical protein LSAT2_028125 [Lamellibrachia satsuma]|nr:hypothetical protein LSAT2_028125 [Lamellibrachia satsuma]
MRPNVFTFNLRNSYEVPRLLLLVIFAMTIRDSIQKVCFGGQIWAVCGKTCTASCDDPKPGPSYCRGKRFHPHRQMCCNGVVTKRPTDYPGCCGTRSYQMAIEECVGGQVERRGSRKTGCIGGTEWTNCGRECSPTCDDPEPSCRTDCVKRYHCPPRKPIFYQGQCITASDCPVKKCKNGQTFSPKTEMCCSGIVSPRPEFNRLKVKEKAVVVKAKDKANDQMLVVKAETMDKAVVVTAKDKAKDKVVMTKTKYKANDQMLVVKAKAMDKAVVVTPRTR